MVPSLEERLVELGRLRTALHELGGTGGLDVALRHPDALRLTDLMVEQTEAIEAEIQDRIEARDRG